jgi:hypothetical protein
MNPDRGTVERGSTALLGRMTVRLPAVAVATSLTLGGLSGLVAATSESSVRQPAVDAAPRISPEVPQYTIRLAASSKSTKSKKSTSESTTSSGKPAKGTKTPSNKASKNAKNCSNPRQCDHKDDQGKHRANKRTYQQCGGTIAACDHKTKAKTKQDRTVNPKYNKNKKTYEKCGGTITACDHKDDKEKHRNNKRTYQQCGGTITACDHKAATDRAGKQKRAFESCGGTIAACDHKGDEEKRRKNKAAFEQCGGTIAACDHKGGKPRTRVSAGTGDDLTPYGRVSRGAAVSNAALDGLDSYTKTQQHMRKDWPLSRETARMKHHPRLDTPAFKTAAKRIAIVGAFTTYVDNRTKGDSVAEAGTKTGVSIAAGWAGAKVGALIGGAAGSVVPIIGNAGGALIGATLGGIGGMLFAEEASEQIDKAWK